MKLCRKLIPGNTFVSEAVSGIFEYEWQSSVQEGYEEALLNGSAMEGISSFAKYTSKDYKYIRNEIKSLYTSIGWSGLSAAEKVICTEYFVATSAERLEIYAISTLCSKGKAHHSKSIQSRQVRFLAACAEVFNTTTKQEYSIIISEMAALSLDGKYMNFGIEGSVEGDVIPGLFDYVEARTVSGTTFNTDGLAAKNIIPTGMTLAQLVTKVMDILKNGNY